MIIRDKFGRFKKGSVYFITQRIKVNCSYCDKQLLIKSCLWKNRKNFFCNQKCKAEWQKDNLKEEGNPFYNKNHTKETKRLISISKIGKSSWNLGKHHSKETRRKISEAYTKERKLKASLSIKGENNPAKRLEVKNKIRAYRMKQKLPTKNTSIEKKLFKELTNRKIPFTKHKSILGMTQPDVFVEPDVCIYADGDYWHNRDEVKERDNKINTILLKNGFLILRYWENEVNANVEGCVDEIEDVLMFRGMI